MDDDGNFIFLIIFLLFVHFDQFQIISINKK